MSRAGLKLIAASAFRKAIVGFGIARMITPSTPADLNCWACGPKSVWVGSYVITVAGLASSVVVAGLILRGISALRNSRFDAYRWFDRALIVQVFVTEVFAFLERQFGAVFELLLFMGLLLTLRVMIHTELHAAATAQPRRMNAFAR